MVFFSCYNVVTTVTEVRSASLGLVLHAQYIFRKFLFAGTWRPLVSVITTLLCCEEYFHH